MAIMTKTEALQHFGTLTNIAEALRQHGYAISIPAISNWPEKIPMQRQYELERITGGKLKADVPDSGAGVTHGGRRRRKG